MSMPALCASSVSCTRIGSARALICRSLPLLSGYSTTETSVSAPFATVTWTCTGPQRGSAASPVTVVEAEVAEEDGAVVEPAASSPEVPPCTGETTEEPAGAAAGGGGEGGWAQR